MKTITTNKGKFNIRYVYQQFNAIHGDIDIIVIEDAKGEQPFTGKFGDEIPMLESYRLQYDIKRK